MKNLRNITLAVLFVVSTLIVSSCSDTNNSDFEPMEINTTSDTQEDEFRGGDDGEIFPGGI